MPPSTPRIVAGASVAFFLISAIGVTISRDQDRADMRVAVTKDKERIRAYYEKQLELSTNEYNKLQSQNIESTFQGALAINDETINNIPTPLLAPTAYQPYQPAAAQPQIEQSYQPYQPYQAAEQSYQPYQPLQTKQDSSL